jgi:DNA invertase Pin-like site-specific DNA recombinase
MINKKDTYVSWARVSTQSQAKTGFSLDVQEDAIQDFVDQKGGKIIKSFKVAETARRGKQRIEWEKFIAYLEENKAKITGVVFYSVDRAFRNLQDLALVDLFPEKLSVKVNYVLEGIGDDPASILNRDIRAVFASEFIRNLSRKTKDGLKKRAMNGLFTGKAPFGYENYKNDNGRSLIRTHSKNAQKVQRIYELYAYHNHSLDSLGVALFEESIFYKNTKPEFPRTTLEEILKNEAYIGKVLYNGIWYAGQQESLIDMITWNRIQERRGKKSVRHKSLLFAGNLIKWGECGRAVTGEIIRKPSGKFYIYYRCSGYTKHPDKKGARLTEIKLEKQMLVFFERLKLNNPKVKGLFISVLKAVYSSKLKTTQAGKKRLESDFETLENKQQLLLALYMSGDLVKEAFTVANSNIQKQMDTIDANRKVSNDSREEEFELAVKTFELCLK